MIPIFFICLWLTCVEEDKIKFSQKAQTTFFAMGNFIFAVVLGLFWTTQLFFFSRERSWWLVPWSMLCEPLKYYSKMYVVAPVLVRINAERWFVSR